VSTSEAGTDEARRQIMIIVTVLCIIALVGLVTLPFLVSFLIACRYAETLPEEEQEKFWREYNEHISREVW